MTLPEDKMKTETIPAGQKFQVNIPIEKEGTELVWNFKSDHYDIGFYVYFQNQDNNNDDVLEELVSCPRCDSHINTQKGRLVCSKTGKCEWQPII